MHSRQVSDSPDQRTEASYTVEPIANEMALSALEADWNWLSETAEQPNAFMTYGWFRSWTSRRAAEHRTGRFIPNVRSSQGGDHLRNHHL